MELKFCQPELMIAIRLIPSVLIVVPICVGGMVRPTTPDFAAAAAFSMRCAA